MTITLPRLPRRSTAYELRAVRNSEVQRAGTGGSLSPLTRSGDHWAVEVDVGVLATMCGRALLADLVRGVGERIRVPIPQYGFEIGLPGGTSSVPHSDGSYFSDGTGYAPITPRVSGAGQAGTSLSLDGMTPGYLVKKGLFFTLETTFGSSAHIITAEATANTLGQATIEFWPMLWLEPSDLDSLEMFEPYIEGLLVDEGGQSSGLFRSVTTGSFTIEEG